LYNECDIGVCFSATNYSLVPQEMMMCKLPVVEIDLESTHAIFPEGVVALAEPNPISIASKIHELVESKDMRHLTAENGYRWASQFSWQQSARDVESAILERLGISKAHELQNKTNHKDEIYVSVIMPSYNGGEMTRRVIDKLVAQKAPWKFEIIVVDSSSSDGTWDYLTNLGEKVRAVSIKKSEFQHGRTRNLAVSMARGKYVVVLTQDALPVDDYLLYNFAVVMDRFPNAAGAFGRHFPWPDASVFTKRDINNHFDVMKNGPLSVSRFYNAELYRSENLAHRQYLHYFSDNNACLRKSVWDRIKYPEIDYGEDQAWADEIIKAGYQKIYVEKAQVFHSHDYNEIQTFERARTDAEFFRKVFGYDVAPADSKEEIISANIADETWGIRNNVPIEEINMQKKLNAHRLFGLSAGSVQGITYKSPF
jgi:glycosyltransferase involved in cell wall biosynthesis